MSATAILARPCASVPRTLQSDHGLQATVAPAPDNFGGFEVLLHDSDSVLIGVRYFDSESAAERYAQLAVAS
jgi:hypothetical protein